MLLGPIAEISRQKYIRGLPLVWRNRYGLCLRKVVAEVFDEVREPAKEPIGTVDVLEPDPLGGNVNGAKKKTASTA
jgi:hypothetical protein